MSSSANVRLRVLIQPVPSTNKQRRTALNVKRPRVLANSIPNSRIRRKLTSNSCDLACEPTFANPPRTDVAYPLHFVELPVVFRGGKPGGARYLRCGRPLPPLHPVYLKQVPVPPVHRVAARRPLRDSEVLPRRRPLRLRIAQRTAEHSSPPSALGPFRTLVEAGRRSTTHMRAVPRQGKDRGPARLWRAACVHRTLIVPTRQGRGPGDSTSNRAGGSGPHAARKKGSFLPHLAAWRRRLFAVAEAPVSVRGAGPKIWV